MVEFNKQTDTRSTARPLTHLSGWNETHLTIQYRSHAIHRLVDSSRNRAFWTGYPNYSLQPLDCD